MKNYRVQDSCRTCRHVNAESDFEGLDMLFCELKTKMPLLPVSNEDDCVRISKMYAKHGTWRDSHRVSESGICDNWGKRK